MKLLIWLVCAFLPYSLSVPVEDDPARTFRREISELISTEHYIEDGPHLTVPNVKEYLEENVLNSLPVGKTQYVLLVSRSGRVIIMDGNSYDQITTYYDPKFYWVTVVIVNDTLYNIDTSYGSIESANIENVITLPQNGINWNDVGKFPKESYPNENATVQSAAAVNGSVFYFVSRLGILYKYDTILKTTTKCAVLPTMASAYSLIIVDGILYIYAIKSFYSFDGILLRTLATPETRVYPGLFEFKGNICRVGGDLRYAGNDQLPMYCYEPNEETWAVVSYTNEVRGFPGVATTLSGTIIFGGHGVNSSIDSSEIFNHYTKIWSYIPSPPAMKGNWYSAISFYF